MFSFARKSYVYLELIIFESNADEKSKQNTWISLCNDSDNKLKIQLIIFSLRNIVIKSLSALNFYKVAIQNLYVTLPNSYSFKT